MLLILFCTIRSFLNCSNLGGSIANSKKHDETLRISQIYFTLPTFSFWNLLRSIRINLGKFPRDSQFNGRIYRIHKSPSLARVPRKLFLPTYVRHNKYSRTKHRGFAGRAERYFSTPVFSRFSSEYFFAINDKTLFIWYSHLPRLPFNRWPELSTTVDR